ncbi:MAG: hypothetical protein KDB27_24990 [Planctomycetales bacterium]|nr:hypothetical protein [Planctomycetales bacterium]
MDWEWLDERPIIVAIAGSNGAGKTTFYQSHIAPAGLRFINADDLAKQLNIGAYEASAVADNIRRELVRQGESFAFETVFSDPVGDKVAWLKETSDAGINVVLCFIGIPDPDTSDQRVGMRVSQGGHDVPPEKVKSRFPRTLANLKLAIAELPRVIVFDNSDLAEPYKRVAIFNHGEPAELASPSPQWLKDVLN